MKTHLRGNLLVFASTLVICCVLYPALLYAIGRGVFPTSSGGSLVSTKDGIGGSRHIAQPFTGDEYFWPRPSAASYNAAAAGGSNWGANNPKLRDRVAQQLGPMVVYKAGTPSAVRSPQQDIAEWFAAHPDAATVPPDGNAAAAAFDAWVSDPANAAKVADLEPVAADMVMASGAGLDPHVTMRNALSVYQLDRVAKARGVSREQVAEVVRANAFTPLSGLVGEPLVNVLDANLALDAKFPRSTQPAR